MTTTDPTIILREAIKSVVIESEADDLLATRIPQACQTCKGSGQIDYLKEGIGRPTLPCPDCPTIGTLLLYGWNVAKATVEDRSEGGAPYVNVHYPVSTKYAVNLLTELRDVPQ